MGFRAVRDFLITRIRNVVPIRDPKNTFVCEEDSSGNVIPMELHTRMVADRTFDIRINLSPVDDGEAGRSNRRFRVGLLLRVAYRMDKDRGYMEEMATEDMYRLTDALVLAPTVAGWAAAGGVSVGIPEMPEITLLKFRLDEAQEEELDVTQTAVVNIPFFLFYYEDP